MSNIISCSISEEQKKFIEEMGLSPSELLQNSINEEINSLRVSQTIIKDLNRKIRSLIDTIDKQRKFIESKKLIEEFLKC
jgi:hypothetical protein